MAFKDTSGKAQVNLIPYKAEEQVAYVRQYGNRKYNDPKGDGYKDVAVIDFAAAAKRHLGKYFAGEKFDEESGLSHLAHAACSIMLALSNEDVSNLRTLQEADEVVNTYDEAISAFIDGKIGYKDLIIERELLRGTYDGEEEEALTPEEVDALLDDMYNNSTDHDEEEDDEDICEGLTESECEKLISELQWKAMRDNGEGPVS